MKSSTYASVVTIVFLLHRNKVSKSIQSVIRTADALCKELKLRNNLSHMTKYRIISDLLQSKILTSHKTKKTKKLRLSQSIVDMF
ncbi:MAG: hypothetical protein QXS02_05670 [Candidatus Thermoplasmatota archaeon]